MITNPGIPNTLAAFPILLSDACIWLCLICRFLRCILWIVTVSRAIVTWTCPSVPVPMTWFCPLGGHAPLSGQGSEISLSVVRMIPPEEERTYHASVTDGGGCGCLGGGYLRDLAYITEIKTQQESYSKWGFITETSGTLMVGAHYDERRLT